MCTPSCFAQPWRSGQGLALPFSGAVVLESGRDDFDHRPVFQKSHFAQNFPCNSCPTEPATYENVLLPDVVRDSITAGLLFPSTPLNG